MEFWENQFELEVMELFHLGFTLVSNICYELTKRGYSKETYRTGKSIHFYPVCKVLEKHGLQRKGLPEKREDRLKMSKVDFEYERIQEDPGEQLTFALYSRNVAHVNGTGPGTGRIRS